jgi:hypothetical protein
MTQSNSLRDELVKQNGASGATPAAVDAELANLRRVIDAEQQRVRRLARWTKRVWLLAGLLLLVPVLGSFLYLSLARADGPPPAQTTTMPTTTTTTMPTTTPAPRDDNDGGGGSSGFAGAVSAVFVTLLLLAVPASLVCLLIGIILMVMTFTARRTAGMNEIRASLATIDAQLRMLAPPPSPPDRPRP